MVPQASPEPASGLRNREAFLSAAAAGPEAICKQLERLLTSPAFKNSKRCSDLLTYLVQRAVDDPEAAPIKERTVGIEVFGRGPQYDTSADHVVRSMASEIRKRLAQYYMEPEHDTELRIDVPSGSYAARFRLPSVQLFQEPSSISTAEKIVQTPPPEAKRARPWLVPILTVAAAAVFLAAPAIGTLFSERSGSTLDRFWRPVLSPANPILLCIGNLEWPRESAQGEPAANTDAGRSMTLEDFHSHKSQKVFLDDAITLAKVAGLMQEKGQRFRIMSHSTATFGDLQNGPAVLIGLRSNFWTGSLIGQLRFSVEQGIHTLTIRDKRNPSRRDWFIDISAPYLQTTRDYALVVRVLNPKTGQMVVTAAGLTAYGTLAAGEFLTNPAQLKKLEAYAPKDWEHKNLAIVLSTDVIKASAGSPDIVAADFW
jgi:hypothetical protein